MNNTDLSEDLIHQAVQLGNIEVIEELLKHFRVVSDVTFYDTAEYLVKQEELEAVRRLFTKYRNRSAHFNEKLLDITIFLDKPKSMQLLIELGIRFNSISTPEGVLRRCLRLGACECVQELLESGVRLSRYYTILGDSKRALGMRKLLEKYPQNRY
jgi:hypothetical protein